MIARILTIAALAGFAAALGPAKAGMDPAEALLGPAKAAGYVSQTAPATTTRIPQFENEQVKVWKSVIVPNAPLTLHRHEHGRTIVALVGGDLKIVKASGETTVAHWETGKAYWLPADPPGEMHKDVNDTGRNIEVMVVEMK